MGNSITKYDVKFDSYIANIIVYCNQLLSDKNDKYISKGFHNFYHNTVLIGGHSFHNNNVNIILLWKLIPYNSNYNVNYPITLNDGHFYIYGAMPSFSVDNVDKDTKLYDITDNVWVNGPDSNDSIAKEVESFAKVINNAQTYNPTFFQKAEKLSIINGLQKGMAGGSSLEPISQEQLQKKIQNIYSFTSNLDHVDLMILQELLIL